MITNAKDFYASIQGKRVAFCGIGGQRKHDETDGYSPATGAIAA